jgi:hypothetical protein
MDAPPEHEPSTAFIALARALKERDVCVPELIAIDEEQGFLLLTDFGDQLLADVLTHATVDEYYQQALHTLASLQALNIEVPIYTAELLLDECRRFDHWYLKKHLNNMLTEQQQQLIDTTYQQLVASATEQPYVFVHRDFHCRNIMVLDSGQLGIIDFQDAVRGPISYDLVSLLRDCYVDWPPEQVYRWVDRYSERIVVDRGQLRRWFDLMGVQRHLKAIGHFARLNHRDDKPHYLPYIPRVLNYVSSVCAHYPELEEFGRFINS